MNANRTQILDQLDKIKTIVDSLDRALNLMSLPSVEQQMTDKERASAFRAWSDLYDTIDVVKYRQIHMLIQEWTLQE